MSIMSILDHFAKHNDILGVKETLRNNLATAVRTDPSDNNTGNTSLHYACEHSNSDMLSLLVKHASVDINSRNYAGDTPLHIVCRNIHTSNEIIKLGSKMCLAILVLAGCDLNITNNNNIPAFHNINIGS